MPPLLVWQQSDFLYDEMWTAEIDNSFIDLMVDQAMSGNFRVGAENSLAIEVVQWIISNHFGKEFTFLDCKRHVKKIQKRHRVFDWIVHMAGVLYDSTTNTIIGAPYVWDHICKNQPFSYAYMTKGDPKWRELQIIFNDAPNTSPLFLENVIDISSSDDNDTMFIVENGGAMFGPVVQGFPVYGIPMVEDEEVLNAPYLESAPLIDLTTDDTSSPDNHFWQYVFKGFADNSSSDGVEDNNGDLFNAIDGAKMNFPNNDDYDPPSPINSINSVDGFISSSSSDSNNPTCEA